MLAMRTTHKAHRGSVLPASRATRSEGGAVLHAKRAGHGGLLTIPLLILGAVVFGGYALTGDLDVADAIEAVVTSVVAVLTALVFWQDYRRRSPLRRGSVRFGSWPLRFGEEVTVELHATMKKRVSNVTATVECVETAVSGGGKFAKTSMATRFSRDLSPDKLEIDRLNITAQWTFVVPEEGPQSLSVASNVVLWDLKVRIITVDGVDVPADFTLVVIPEVAA